MAHQVRPLGWLRLRAWLIDWLAILVGLLGVAAISLILRSWTWSLSTVGWNLVIALLTVVPVTAWLAWRESRAAGSTPGKKRLGLSVVATRTGESPGYARALVRNALKVAVPWQLGHLVAAEFASQAANAATPAWTWLATAVVYPVMVIYVAALFVGSGRAPYDVVAGTRVDRRSKGPQQAGRPKLFVRRRSSPPGRPPAKSRSDADDGHAR